jgi:hypothetical protein
MYNYPLPDPITEQQSDQSCIQIVVQSMWESKFLHYEHQQGWDNPGS